MSNVYVYIESYQGQMVSASLEALGAARGIADELDAELTAIVLGHGVGDVATAAFDLGADNVLGSDDPSLAEYRADAYGPLLSHIVGEYTPDVFLAGATSQGRDLSAWVAADLEAGVIADVTGLRVENGRLLATRPVYASKLLCDTTIPAGLQIVTLRSRAFAPATSMGNTGEAHWIAPIVAEGDLTTAVVGFKAKEGGVSLTEAKIIVSGGRGVGGPEGFAPVKALADTLGGALGASRAAVDAGWIPYEHQVGQTGKTVSPDLYIACGISGAIQHQAGMRTAKVIVAINKDGEAPIFKLASYGIVGDLFTILPALQAAFAKRLG